MTSTSRASARRRRRAPPSASSASRSAGAPSSARTWRTSPSPRGPGRSYSGRCSVPRADAVGPAVVVPARNAADTLPALLRALAAQTLPPAAVVVAEDGSSDGTADVARAHGAEVVATSPPGGPGVARNAGAAAAAGDLLLFLDADTLPPADWIERILARLDAEGPETVAVWGGYAGPTVDSPLARLQHHDIAWHQRVTPPHTEILTSANFVVRRAAFEASGGFPPMQVDEDYVFGARLARIGRVRFDPAILVGHRFRTAWAAYLRQQRSWARGIPEMYARAPRLLARPQSFRRGRISLELGLLIAAGAAAVAAPLLGGPLSAAAAAAGLFGWDACGAAFRRHLRDVGETGLPVRRYLFLRDLAWLAGLAEGCLRLPAALSPRR